MAAGASILANLARSVAVSIGTAYFETLGHGFPCTVTAVPGGGGTLTISYSTTPDAARLGAAATWTAWPAATVATPTSATLISPITGLRAVAAAAAGIVEIVG